MQQDDYAYQDFVGAYITGAIDVVRDHVPQPGRCPGVDLFFGRLNFFDRSPSGIVGIAQISEKRSPTPYSPPMRIVVLFCDIIHYARP